MNYVLEFALQIILNPDDDEANLALLKYYLLQIIIMSKETFL